MLGEINTSLIRLVKETIKLAYLTAKFILFHNLDPATEPLIGYVLSDAQFDWLVGNMSGFA